MGQTCQHGVNSAICDETGERALMQFVQRKGETWCRCLFLCLLSLLSSLLVSYPHRSPLSTWPCLTHRWAFLRRRGSQAEFIRLRSKKGERKEEKKEKADAGALRKDCISRREPQDRRTGQQTASTDTRQLPFMHTRHRDQAVWEVKKCRNMMHDMRKIYTFCSYLCCNYCF